MITLYRCWDCDDLHSEATQAQLCCADYPDEVYLCEQCETEHSAPEAARGCCNAAVRCPRCARWHGEKSLNAHSVNLTGHCNICSPFYTKDQERAIADSFNAHTHKWGDIRTGEVGNHVGF